MDARLRFELQLKETQKSQQKTINDYQRYLEQSLKFKQLKAMRKMDAELICQDTVKNQMFSEQQRRIESREARRSTMGHDGTYGPTETVSSMFQAKQKKAHDQQYISVELKKQMIMKNQEEAAIRQNQHQIDSLNIQ